MKPDSLENLPCHLEREGFHLHWSPQCPCPPERLLALAMQREAPRRWLKQTRRRKIMEDHGALIKLYTLEGVRDLTHSRRYASREVECYHDYLAAFGTLPGVRLPRLYGYFARPFLRFLFRANGIVEEFIADTCETTCAQLPLLPPLFAHLYRKGIYHPDMQFQNILWQPATHTLVPIDYMGCNVLPQPNWEALLMQLAWFCVAGRLPADAARELLNRVLDLLPELTLNRDRAWQCVQLLHSHPFETHQYHAPRFLPPRLKAELFSD